MQSITEKFEKHYQQHRDYARDKKKNVQTGFKHFSRTTQDCKEFVLKYLKKQTKVLEEIENDEQSANHHQAHINLFEQLQVLKSEYRHFTTVALQTWEFPIREFRKFGFKKIKKQIQTLLKQLLGDILGVIQFDSVIRKDARGKYKVIQPHIHILSEIDCSAALKRLIPQEMQTANCIHSRKTDENIAYTLLYMCRPGISAKAEAKENEDRRPIKTSKTLDTIQAIMYHLWGLKSCDLIIVQNEMDVWQGKSIEKTVVEPVIREDTQVRIDLVNTITGDLDTVPENYKSDHHITFQQWQQENEKKQTVTRMIYSKKYDKHFSFTYRKKPIGWTLKNTHTGSKDSHFDDS